MEIFGFFQEESAGRWRPRVCSPYFDRRLFFGMILFREEAENPVEGYPVPGGALPLDSSEPERSPYVRQSFPQRSEGFWTGIDRLFGDPRCLGKGPRSFSRGVWSSVITWPKRFSEHRGQRVPSVERLLRVFSLEPVLSSSFGERRGW